MTFATCHQCGICEACKEAGVCWTDGLLASVGIFIVSHEDYEPGAVLVSVPGGGEYCIIAGKQLASQDWDSGLTSLGNGTFGRLLDREDVAAAFEAALRHYQNRSAQGVDEGGEV